LKRSTRRNIVRRRILAAICTIGLTAIAGGSAWAEVQPGDQLPIMTPGCGETVHSSFRLGANLDCVGNGLLIGDPGITIDLNKKTLSGDLEDIGISPVDPAVGNTTVRNGAVRGFQYGLSLGPASKINNVVIVDHEFGVETSEGLLLSNSTVVANNVGVTSGASPGVVIENNRFSTNDTGIVISFVVGSPPPVPVATKIRHNVIAGNFERGIWISNGSEHVVAENTISGNGNSGTGTGFPGIEIDPPANAIRTIDNDIDGNGNDGYRDDGTDNEATGNKARGNGFQKSDGDGTGIEGGTNPTGSKNLSLGNDSATQCTHASMCKSPSKSYRGPTLPLKTPACESTVKGSFRLAHDVTCAGDWIDIGKPDVIVDLNGHTVKGAETDGELGAQDIYHRAIESYVANTTVRNGAIRGFSGDGVFSGRGGDVRDVVIADSGEAVVSWSEENVISMTRNVLAGNLTGLSGFGGYDATKNAFLANDEGAYIASVSGSTAIGNISENLIAGNRAEGVLLESASNGVGVVENVILGNGHGGDDITGSYAGIRTVAYEDHGLSGETFASEENLIKGNTIEGSGDDGYRDAGTDNTAKSNVSRGNGFLLGVADGTGTGIDASAATSPHGSGNRSIGNDASDQCAPDSLC
jgi:parallel beta-helix repeat protein